MFEIGFRRPAEDLRLGFPVQAARIGAVALGLIVEIGLVVDLDVDRQDVADVERAQILEQRSLAVAP